MNIFSLYANFIHPTIVKILKKELRQVMPQF